MQEIVRIAERPDLVPMVAQWLWDEWHLDAGDSFEAIRDAVAASVSPSGPPQTFVLLVDNRPVGTASLVAHDLDERPNLTPWLAGVLVIPEERGRGHVIHLIQAVEVGVSICWCRHRVAPHHRCRARVRAGGVAHCGSHPASRKKSCHADAT